MDREFYTESLVAPDAPTPTYEAHELVRISHVGSWWVGGCSCGWKSKILPDKWRIERQHKSHVKWENTPIDKRSPRT